MPRVDRGQLRSTVRLPSGKSTPHLTDDGRVPWRERPHLDLATAAELANCSRAHLYTLEKEKRIQMVKLIGRTLVETRSFIAFLATAQPYVSAGPVARAKRKPGRHDA